MNAKGIPVILIGIVFLLIPIPPIATIIGLSLIVLGFVILLKD